MEDMNLMALLENAEFDGNELLKSEREAWKRAVLTRRFEHRCEQFHIAIDLSKSGLVAGPIHLWAAVGSPTVDTASGQRTLIQAFVDAHQRGVELLGSRSEQLAKAAYDARYDAKRAQHQKELLQLELESLKRNINSADVKAMEEIGVRLDLNSANPKYAVGFIPDEYDPSRIQPTAKDDKSEVPRVFSLTQDVQKDAELSFTTRYRFSIHGRYIHVIPPDSKMIVLTIESEELRDMEDEYIQAKDRADQRSREIAAEELKEEMNNFKFNESLVADVVPHINRTMIEEVGVMVGREIPVGTSLERYANV